MDIEQRKAKLSAGLHTAIMEMQNIEQDKRIEEGHRAKMKREVFEKAREDYRADFKAAKDTIRKAERDYQKRLSAPIYGKLQGGAETSAELSAARHLKIFEAAIEGRDIEVLKSAWTVARDDPKESAGRIIACETACQMLKLRASNPDTETDGFFTDALEFVKAVEADTTSIQNSLYPVIQEKAKEAANARQELNKFGFTTALESNFFEDAIDLTSEFFDKDEIDNSNAGNAEPKEVL